MSALCQIGVTSKQHLLFDISPNMSDPIPSATADPDSDHAAHANAEDRKAAAALSSLNVNEITTDGVSDGANTNQDALGKAMSRLEIVGGQGQNTKGTNVQKSDGEVAKKKVVKVAAADVALLVDQLELSRIKATELLKAHDGDVVKAMKAFIAPSFRA
ncbi:unnamed protein product [Penicillium salamii]|uniref:Nascent polypeptide-associated complex subunit alpha-like UBA domain-containing protein n=1 Tax=Penicillium salamii TaxID=1612424 RepID=A0A9W4NAU0_9EURO|nr:unnamed protein product [Penicillium salamii]CAG8042864.1 unnamed protein product [Penicillium salamii]CAG8339876.1 unnamed protein product [Penicillium salamii]CAG8340001.1 unnamed protein product [Penicillium salamii]CAG8344879.1 unnamed protein product [Penicillium salamii]